MSGTLLPSANLSTACVVGFKAISFTVGLNATDNEAIDFCRTQISGFAAGVAQQAATSFGGPGVVIGASLPWIFVGLIIAIMRLFRIVNARSLFLFIATLGNMAFASAIVYAFKGLDANYLVSDVVGLSGFIILLTFLAMAGITRFGQVITRTKRRKLFQRGLCTFVLLYAGLLGYRAGKEIIEAPSYPTTFTPLFTGLCFVPLVIYILGGLFCFSWNLPRHALTLPGGNGRIEVLRTLRIVNDVMMALVIALCVSELGCFFPLRTSSYNNSVACLHISIVLFIENIFETVSNAMRGKGVFSANTSQHTESSELSAINRVRNGNNPTGSSSSSSGRYMGPYKSDNVAPAYTDGRNYPTDTWKSTQNSPYGTPYGTNSSHNAGSRQY
ncbi:uncharacterized protein SPPG_04385 [Spizellomyces punctatus DAOM BR117]|uniref:Uncharacterized protein n=1 Tax=Spizellomyces punctatus (strain DAOM BR117) TaxID=645134 RepID=A0A0L0HEZ9_SPIPD|nr:uncharacterized protein SPPG_04385 [Spizellomyces punctatus DAOM BR117]KND00041.1 hypothetical protein SPPG_04385 [Spizellomyces punctatus DAOM BR117]|eukprot:XP_016608080.1 hypothetical protein SPPG_04385 [Spizellomyces punctatus DAOM BR117]